VKPVPTGIAGLVVLEPRVFSDARGAFLETFSERVFADIGLPTRFAQDNLSTSRKGVLRGLHFQNPTPQGKLVRCVQGAVWDVAVDCRPASSTFGKWYGVELTAANRVAMYVPEGFAHGFYVLSDGASFEYKCTALYAPAADGGLLWNDPQLDIRWPLDGEPILSEKDRKLPTLEEARRAGRLDGF
jgi:dTDP-4-dehydrorhamnose 3,5-epimerase